MEVLIIKYKKKIKDMNKTRTVTPEGALKKMNFEAGKTITGKESRAEVIKNLPKRRHNTGLPPKYPTIQLKGGDAWGRGAVPHKLVDGVWVPLTKVAK
jgi:hypothetical protein